MFTKRLEEVNPSINAMTQDRFKEAHDEAQKIDELLTALRSGRPESEFSPDELEKLHSPLLGVPVSVKESIQVKGMRNSCGLWDRRNVSAASHSVVVQNVQRLGMVPICTSNIPECTLYWADCQNPVYGRSLNPYNFGRITGASSGGEGALLGAGCSVIGIGSDIGGSLRIPAHYCGIYSHKPSPFLVSSVGNFPEVKESRLRMFTLGPMCRYATDLKPLLKCLLSDKENPKQDTYYKFQPDNIGSLRQQLVQKLDEPVDLSQVKILYFNFKDSKLTGRHSIQLSPEFLDTQQELIEHFQSKFNCSVQSIDPDKYFKKILICWQCMITAGGVVDRDTEYDEREINKVFGIDNMFLEFLKMPFGLSKHTKESILGIALGMNLPRDRAKLFPLCEKFEKVAAEMKADFESQLGDSGVLIVPTLPTVAYKHNVSLLKMPDLRFPALFNVIQLPTTHATIRLDKKHQMPYGFSIAAKGYNDHLTLSVAEEIEQTFGGWTPPALATVDSSKSSSTAKKATEKTIEQTNDNQPSIAVPSN